MKRQWISAMAAAATLALAACDGATSPTEPILREPTPRPPANSLVGAWHGTMSYRGGDCASEEVNATVTPDGTGLRLNLRSLCYGHVVFRLQEQVAAVTGTAEVVYNGSCNSIFGIVSRPTLPATASGTADGTRIHLETENFGVYYVLSCTRPGVILELAR